MSEKDNSNSQENTYGVLIRAYGPDDEPGEARHREYLVDAENIKQAKEDAVEVAKNHLIKGIIGSRDSYDIIEIEEY